MENGKYKTDKELRELSVNYFDRAEKEWNEIQEVLFKNFSVTAMNDLREVIDEKLNQLKNFDDSLNSVFR